MRTQRVGTLQIDQRRLLKELEKIDEFIFADAYSEYLCGGPWKSCMLWSASGKVGDGLVTNYDQDAPVAKTAYGEQLPYLSEIVERSFNLDHLRFARLAIISNSVIIPHRDLLELNEVPTQVRNAHRLHVPLITNENCYFSDRNVVYRMRFGEVWFFDATRMHAAASFSDQKRIHLMLDFSDVDDEDDLLRIPRDGLGTIPQVSICQRDGMTDAEREALLSLSHVIDMDNYRDIFSIVIRKHFRKDGGEDFVWNTVTKIADSSHNPAVVSKIKELHQYFLLERSPQPLA
jgi:hypothetical protein